MPNQERSSNTSELSAIEREKIVSLREAAQLRGKHVDTIRRNDRHLIIQLSQRRQGMKLKHVLKLD
jgi:hypothetical protein